MVLVQERFKPLTCKSICFGSPEFTSSCSWRKISPNIPYKVKPQEDPIDALLRLCRWFIALWCLPETRFLSISKGSLKGEILKNPVEPTQILIISLVIFLTTGDSSMSGSLVENELQLCERPCLSLSKHWQLKLEPACIPFPSRPKDKLQLTIWICLYSCSPDQLLGKNQVPGPYSMHWIISSPHATAPAKKNVACFSTSSFFVEVARFRVSSCFQENSHCWWIIMYIYLYTLYKYIVRGIHILLQMHFVTLSDRYRYSVHQICRDTRRDSDCVWLLPITKRRNDRSHVS